jgi:hypothetical protein
VSDYRQQLLDVYRQSAATFDRCSEALTHARRFRDAAIVALYALERRHDDNADELASAAITTLRWAISQEAQDV